MLTISYSFLLKNCQMWTFHINYEKWNNQILLSVSFLNFVKKSRKVLDFGQHFDENMVAYDKNFLKWIPQILLTISSSFLLKKLPNLNFSYELSKVKPSNSCYYRVHHFCSNSRNGKISVKFSIKTLYCTKTKF